MENEMSGECGILGGGGEKKIKLGLGGKKKLKKPVGKIKNKGGKLIKTNFQKKNWGA